MAGKKSPEHSFELGNPLLVLAGIAIGSGLIAELLLPVEEVVVTAMGGNFEQGSWFLGTATVVGVLGLLAVLGHAIYEGSKR